MPAPTGLNASTTTYAPNTVISSAAANNNNNALNGAVNPTFSTLGVGSSVQFTVDSSGNIATSTGRIGFAAAGDMLDFNNANACYIKNRSGTGQVIFQSPNGTQYAQWPPVHFSISATGTVTHSFGYTPTFVRTECQIASSNTTGHDTVGSSTAHITLGAAQSNDVMMS